MSDRDGGDDLDHSVSSLVDHSFHIFGGYVDVDVYIIFDLVLHDSPCRPREKMKEITISNM